MIMEPRIETITEKKLVGKSLRMTVAVDRTPELWWSFMPFRKEIEGVVGTDLYCVQVYDSDRSSVLSHCKLNMKSGQL